MKKTVLILIPIKADHILYDGLWKESLLQLRLASGSVSYEGIQSLFSWFCRKNEKRKVQKRQRPVNDEEIYEQ